MSSYIGIVPVTFDADFNSKVYLYACPPWKHYKEGDYVMVEEGNFARLKADVLTLDSGSDTYKWLVEVSGAKDPLKKIKGIISEVRYE